ncbi:MAG: MFS transporter [Rhizobiaceae bacterium]|nr:MFS transporter [Rhizobiaceae bacterium]
MTDSAASQMASSGFSAYVRRHSAGQLLLWSSFYYVLPALSAVIVTQTGWPVLHVSTTYTIAILVWAFFAPAVGAGVDSGHGRLIMRSGAIVGVVILLAVSQSTNMWVFSGLIIALGIPMAATLYDPCFTLLMRSMGRNADRAIANVTLIAGMATLLTFPAALWLSAHLPWREVLIVFAGLAGVGAMLLPAEPASQTAPQDRPQDRPKGRSYREIITPGSALIALSFGLVMFGHAILLFLLPFILAQMASVQAGLQDWVILAPAVLGPAQIAGRLLWGAYGYRLGARRATPFVFALVCLPPLILAVAPSAPGAIFTALILQGGCFGVQTILRPMIARDHLPAARLGQGLGAIAMVGIIMMALGPASGGMVLASFGHSGLMIAILTADLVALGLICLLFWKWGGKHA